MSIPVKKLKCGFEMPVFGMGSWMMGGNSEKDPDNDGQNDISALIAGLERGLKHIDTAEMYAQGFAEQIVGQALKGRNRESLFITSKVWNDHLASDDVLRACENSLKRLGTDYLDLYLIHKPNDDIPLQDTIKALDRLADEKMIRAIGVSNFAVSRLKRAQDCASHKIVLNQVHYNLSYREPETELLSYCQNNHIMLEAWRPLQKGAILDAASPLLDEICEKYRKTRSQIALNWLISQPNVVTMSTMRSIRHIEENLGAVGWHMHADDINRLRHEFPGQHKISDAVPLS
ncbi:aldo/keto reductase [Lentisphaerota bacterium ZTH]|nr:aldo/keto reductase [Lentisphaerota bacterium]WET07561.1 aldo/keto reductase [Lentisphaerota bacterium ZTH]